MIIDNRCKLALASQGGSRKWTAPAIARALFGRQQEVTRKTRPGGSLTQISCRTAAQFFAGNHAHLQSLMNGVSQVVMDKLKEEVTAALQQPLLLFELSFDEVDCDGMGWGR